MSRDGALGRNASIKAEVWSGSADGCTCHGLVRGKIVVDRRRRKGWRQGSLTKNWPSEAFYFCDIGAGVMNKKNSMNYYWAQPFPFSLFRQLCLEDSDSSLQTL